MELEFSQLDNGVRLIKLTGMLDVTGVNGIDRQFIQHCEGDGVFVLVDMTRVTYLSSIGIPLLINSAKGVAARGGRLAFVNPQMNVKAVMEMTGVSHMIRVYPDVETGKSRVMNA
jgi:anti-sigma B factor antagonist